MKVLLATSWGQPQCGIQSHSEELIYSVVTADPTIRIDPSAEALDPFSSVVAQPFDLLHLNYHRALHSRWTPSVLQAWKSQRGFPVVITWHDSFAPDPPDQLTQDLCAIADAFVVHEPGVGLEKAIYWRQGVPHSWRLGEYHQDRTTRPILGTIGFDFGWKGFDRICVLAKQSGWGVSLVTPEMSAARETELRALNPWLKVYRNLPTDLAIGTLRGCDATAFLYVCGNSGTSAAIRMGIAAGKPVIAYSTCRQFRDLVADPLGAWTINWVDTEADVVNTLQGLGLVRLDTGIVALAEQDSWKGLGKKYAALYAQVVKR